MKRIFNIILSFILCACCLLPLSACNENVVSSEILVNPRTQTIKVGYVDYAPLNYMYKGNFTGYNTKLAISVFNALGYDVEFVLVEPKNSDRRVVNQDDVYQALNNGEIHCFWGGISDAILKDDNKFYFSYNYMENSPCLVIVKSAFEDTSINSESDFSGKTVAFGQFSAGEIYYNSVLAQVPDINFISCEKGQSSALHKTNSPAESADCAIVDSLFAYYNIYKTDEYGNLLLNSAYDPDNPNIYEIDQKNYLRVVFNKDSFGEELRDNVNKAFEFFAKTFTTVNNKRACLFDHLASGETFGDKSLKDFIIKDFTLDN